METPPLTPPASPPSTPLNMPQSKERIQEEERLRIRAECGVYAPVFPNGSAFFTQQRKACVERYVREGLEKYDAKVAYNNLP